MINCLINCIDLQRTAFTDFCWHILQNDFWLPAEAEAFSFYSSNKCNIFEHVPKARKIWLTILSRKGYVQQQNKLISLKML